MHRAAPAIICSALACTLLVHAMPAAAQSGADTATGTTPAFVSAAPARPGVSSRLAPTTGGGAPVTAARVQPSSEDLPLGVGSPPPPTQAGPSAGSSPAGLFRTALALGSVLALIVLLAGVLRWLGKKGALKTVMGSIAHGAPAPSGVLEVLARYPMGSGTNLLLLKLDRRVLLVSQAGSRAFRSGAASMSTLCELSDPEDVASILMRVRGEEQSRLAARFQEMLAQEDDDAAQALAARTPDARTPQRSPASSRDQARSHISTQTSTPTSTQARSRASTPATAPSDHADPAATLAAARAVALQRRLASAQSENAASQPGGRAQRSRGVMA